MLALTELDAATRGHMEAEFADELSRPDRFVPLRLTPHGRSVWPKLMGEAIRSGDDATLHAALAADPELINRTEIYERNGVLRERKVNRAQAAEMLSTSEFNTFYVRGLSAKLLAEGVETVEIYRAAEPRWSAAACASHEGLVVQTRAVYEGHRATYWPEANPGEFSVPFHSGCHHSIRRISVSPIAG